MSFALAERQAILFCSCPKNAGNLRQLSCYSRQVGLLIAQHRGFHHYPLCFCSPARLSARTVILCSQPSRYLNVLLYLCASGPLRLLWHSHSWLCYWVFLTLLCELCALNSAYSAFSPLFSESAFQIPKLFQIASTRAFVFSSTSISSGHGRANPSLAHLRVASIPIFDPKSCIRAA